VRGRLPSKNSATSGASKKRLTARSEGRIPTAWHIHAVTAKNFSPHD
jgi:hypothetical protein